jgi:hypothetical protein
MIVLMSLAMSGYGAAVLRRMVYGSTMIFSVICLLYVVNGDGLFGTFGTRSRLKATSAAVKSEPS